MAEDVKKEEVIEEVKVEELEEVNGGADHTVSLRVATSEGFLHSDVAETSK